MAYFVYHHHLIMHYQHTAARRSFLVCVHIFFACILLSFSAISQDRSNRGKEFWLGYGFDYSFFNESPVNAQELAIYISTERAATVTVSISNTSWTQTLNIPANTADASILIPKSGPNDARVLTDGLSNRGIHIVSDVPVAVYAHVYATMVSGATMLMPVETYGYTYYSINYTQTTSGSKLPVVSPTTENGPDWYSWFYVIAPEDNTRVLITPSDTTKNGWLPGNTYPVTLNKGEIYSVFGKLNPSSNLAVAASKDMTGSKIVSVDGADGKCHPVGVFSGSGGIRICKGDGGEFVHQQVFPAQAWGTRYLTYHTINNTATNILETNRNYYRVCVQDPTAVVKRNGNIMTGLINNFYYEYMDSTGGDYITSDKPVLVSQYTPNKNQCWNFPVTTPSPPSYGDPEMFYLSPVEQGQKSVLFYVSRKSAIDYVYTNIHLPTVAVASLLVDGNSIPAAQIIPHPNFPSYSVALARLTGPAAQHTITCDSAFTATVYGLGNYESYGYNVGTLINNLNSYSSIANTYNTSGNTDTFTCPKTQVKLFIKTAYQLTSIQWKLSQAGGGINPNTDVSIPSPTPAATGTINGRTYYTYTLPQDFTFTTPGTYYVPVVYEAPDIDNCSHRETATVKVLVKPGPSADFSISAENCLNDSIRFTALSVNAGFNITQYRWDFDDNTTLSTINTVKKFAVPGLQNVRYRIFADNGCTGDTTKVVTILESPVAKFGYSNTLCVGDSVYLTDTSAIAAGNTIVSWNWNFGDNQVLVKNDKLPFYHKYLAPGNYTISLVVISDKGCKSDSLKRSFTILPQPNSAFTTGGNICLGDSVRFIDNSPPLQSLVSWEWDFGDGNGSTKTNPLPFYYEYTAAGNFSASLIVKDVKGCKSKAALIQVLVSQKPTATFTYNGRPCLDSTQTFTSSIPYSSSSPASWYWDFGDGNTLTTSTSHTATHAYTTALPNIRVRHAAVTGCASDTSDIIIPVINSNPVATFTITGDTLCEKKPLLFTVPSTAGIARWVWNFGSSMETIVPPFKKAFFPAGDYTITLKASSAEGCGAAPVQQRIRIAANPVVDAGPTLYLQQNIGKIIPATVNGSGLYTYTWSPPVYLSNPAILNPLANPLNNTTYTLLVTDPATKCAGSDSVQVKVVTKIYVPNIFTPNNDSHNDTWLIPALEFYPSAKVTVYNRYGQVIYQSIGYSKPWDGRYKGEPQPSGSYIYIIQPTSNPNDDIKGSVLIIR